jgi:hypothetical protein
MYELQNKITDLDDLKTLDKFMKKYDIADTDVVFDTGKEMVEGDLRKYFNLQDVIWGDNDLLFMPVTVELKFPMTRDELMDVRKDMDRGRLDFTQYTLKEFQVQPTNNPGGWEDLDKSELDSDKYNVRFDIDSDESLGYAQLTPGTIKKLKDAYKAYSKEPDFQAIAEAWGQTIQQDLTKQVGPGFTVTTWMEDSKDNHWIKVEVEYSNGVSKVFEPAGLDFPHNRWDIMENAAKENEVVAWLGVEDSLFMDEDFIDAYMNHEVANVFENITDYDSGEIEKWAAALINASK